MCLVRRLPFLVALTLLHTLPGLEAEVLHLNSTQELHVQSETQNDVLGKKLFSIWPPFAMIDSPNEACRNDSIKYLNDLHNFEFDALSIYDSAGKIPAGILDGNINQFGNMDQCLKLGARYCLTQVYLKVSKLQNNKLEMIDKQIHSYFMFKSSINEPGKRLPKFNVVNWGLCVPKSCGAQDIKPFLAAIVANWTEGTGFTADVAADSEMCQTLTLEQPLPISTIIVGLSLITYIFFVLSATAYEYFGNELNSSGLFSKFFLCFSLNKNWKKLISVDENPDEIMILHGIRFLNFALIYISHKALSLMFSPFLNRTSMVGLLSGRSSTIVKSSPLYTESFLLMSGILTSYSLGKQLLRNQRINVLQEYLSRFIRLMPSLGVIILIFGFILPYLGSGPQWPLVINANAKLCASYGWRNVLFIHNFYGAEDMCLTDSHHLGTEMFLFLTSPFLVYLVYKRPNQGLSLILCLGVISTILRSYTTYSNHLSLYFYFGESISTMFRTANLMYFLPTHRATTYMMGIGLGYILRKHGRNVKLSNTNLTVGWIVALYGFYHSMIHHSAMNFPSYVYDRIDATIYAGFAPISWALFLSWMIYTSYTGNGGYLDKLLTWKYFQITTRLAYSMYLIQTPLHFFNVGRIRTPGFGSHLNVTLNLEEVICSYVAAIALAIIVEMPFLNLRNVFVKGSKSETTKQEVKKVD